MSFVVQSPYSNTNPSDSYRVVDFEKWCAYINGETTSLPSTAFRTRDAAETECDKRNGTN